MRISIGFDKVVEELNSGLKAHLPWLVSTYGKAEILLRNNENRSVKYPAVYLNSNEYLNVLPNDRLGNFSFILLSDPREYKCQSNLMSIQCSIIFWYNLNTIFPDNNQRYTEAVNISIIKALNSTTITNGSFTFNQLQEEGKNIYREVDYSEVESQYRLQPYAGVRINGTLTYIERG